MQLRNLKINHRRLRTVLGVNIRNGAIRRAKINADYEWRLHFLYCETMEIPLKSVLHPDVQFQLPFSIATFFKAMQLQCPQFRHSRPQIDRNQFAFVVFLGRQCCLDGRYFFKFIGYIINHLANMEPDPRISSTAAGMMCLTDGKNACHFH